MVKCYLFILMKKGDFILKRSSGGKQYQVMTVVVPREYNQQVLDIDRY